MLIPYAFPSCLFHTEWRRHADRRNAKSCNHGKGENEAVANAELSRGALIPATDGRVDTSQ
jgi:hypothetical protein